jgi:hypothetical protein
LLPFYCNYCRTMNYVFVLCSNIKATKYSYVISFSSNVSSVFRNWLFCVNLLLLYMYLPGLFPDWLMQSFNNKYMCIKGDELIYLSYSNCSTLYMTIHFLLKQQHLYSQRYILYKSTNMHSDGTLVFWRKLYYRL